MKSSVPNSIPHRPELLSPAGDWESLKAAVANGADAVYFGLRRFSARGRATNFAAEELPAVFEYLRDRNTKGYVALNTLIFPDEMAEAARLVEAVAGAGADGTIVQDVGLLRLIHRMAPSLPVHASTQMTQTHAEGLRLLEEWGVSRVILARELSLAQVRQIRESCDIELEVFVHGALCISFSGQCLASQTLLGQARSGNRGQCAQACRLPYELVVDDSPGAMPGAMPLPVRGEGHGDDPHAPPRRRVGTWHPTEHPGARYPLSPKDLCAIGSVDELVEAGVAGFKIEGRLKSAEYVAAATRAYRDAMDAAFAGKAPPRDGAELRMAQSFSRGFTEGFLGGAGHQGLVDGQSPKSRGIRVGKVMGVGPSGILVSLSAGADIRPGDGLVFGGAGVEADEQGGRVYTVRPAGGEAARSSAPARGDGPWHHKGSGRMVEIAFGMGAVYSAAVAVGSEVWKSDDPQVRREIRQSYSRDVIWRKRKMSLKVSAGAGGPLRIAAQDEQGLATDAEWPGPLEASARQSLTEESVREQFSRLGNTPYELGTIELSGPDGLTDSIPVMAPKSVLNGLRRELVDKLKRLRAEAAVHKIAGAFSEDTDRFGICCVTGPCAMSLKRGPVTQLCVLVRTLEQMEAVVRFHGGDGRRAAAMVYCDLPDDSGRREAMSLARSAGMGAAAATPVILMPGEEERIEKILDTNPDAVLVRNLAALRMLRKLAPTGPHGQAGGGGARGLTLVGDYHLNVANALSAGAILEAGADRVTACMDLDTDRLPVLLSQVPAEAAEVVVRLHVPMFHTAHCLWAANLPGGRDGSRCHAPTRLPGEALAKPGPRAGTCPPSPCPSPRTGQSMAPGGGRPCRQHRLRLRDRVGEEHPVLVDEAGRSTVFQSRVRSLPSDFAPLAGARWVRVELLEESGEEASLALEECAARLANR